MKTSETSNMYADAQTWNPFKGCRFGCAYCVPSFQQQAKRQKHLCEQCYGFVPHEHPERLGRVPSSEIVFACGNGDIAFADPAYVRRVIDAIAARNGRSRKEQVFYLQSKRPECLAPHVDALPDNVILVTTLETNRDEGYDGISKAPPPSERFRQFLALDWPRKVVTVEPMMDFDAAEFAGWLARIGPEYVWLGYNSRPKQVALPEPSTEKVRELARILVGKGIPVRGKRLRGLDLPGVERNQD